MFVVLLALLQAQAGDVDRVPEDFATIQAAVDQGTSPVIQVSPGQWTGAVVNRPVRIEALPGAVIDRGTRIRRGVRSAFSLGPAADGTEITGFVVDCRARALDLGVYGSVTQMGGAADSVAVTGNSFLGCVQGVTNAGSPVEECVPTHLDGGRYWVVEDNTFTGFTSRSDAGTRGGGIGVVLFNVHAADVVNNRFDGHVEDTPKFATTGINLAGCSDCTVAGNEFAVAGGTHFWTAVANNGFAQRGAAASTGLILADNDASQNSAPHLGIQYRSYDSFDTELSNNAGAAYVDHGHCGDGMMDFIE